MDTLNYLISAIIDQYNYRIVNYDKQLESIKKHTGYNKLVKYNDSVSYKMNDDRLFIYISYDISSDERVFDDVVKLVNQLREIVNGLNISIVSDNKFYKIDWFELDYKDENIDEMCYSLDTNPPVIDRWSLFKNDIINYNPSFNKLSQSSFNDSYIGHNKIDNFEVYLFQMTFYECGLSYNVYLNKRLIEIKPTNKEISKNDFIVLLHYFLNYNISKFNGYSFIIYYGIKTDEMYRIDEVKFDCEDTINVISFVSIDDKENIEPIKLIR